MSPGKILIVDDHREILEFLTIHLKSLGWEVTPASNGKEALEKVKVIRPDLIILDMQMPEINGFEVVRSLKNNPNYRDIPILAATALAMPGDRERCLQAGCDDYIAKPFTEQNLKEHVTTLLSTMSLPASAKSTGSAESNVVKSH